MSWLRSHGALSLALMVTGLATVGVVFIGIGSAGSTPTMALVGQPSADEIETSGAALYSVQCSSCHGIEATGVDGRGPSLEREGPASVDFVLRTGRMPLADPGEQAVRGPTRFSEAEIVALVTYVGGLGSGPAIPQVDTAVGDLANGGRLFRLDCAACHVATGSGSVIGSDRRAPSLEASTPTEIGEAIMIGPGAMPVFGQLDTSDINDIAAYVEALRAESPTGVRGLGGIGPVAEGLAAWLIALVPLIALTRWIGRSRTDPEPAAPVLPDRSPLDAAK